MNHPLKKLAATVAFVYALVAHSGCGPGSAPPPDAGMQRTSGFSMGLSPQGGTVTAGTGMTTGYLQVATGAQSIGNYAGSGPCGAGSAVTAIGSNGVVTCGQAGVANGAGSNVVVKSSGVGSGLVASSVTDDATTWAINGGKVSVNEASGNVTTQGTETVWGNWTGSGNVTLGDASGDTITVNGTTLTNANVTVDGALTVGNGFTSTLNGNVTLGSGSTAGIAFNGVASTALNMNSHLVNNLANGVASSDAAAFGQIATAVSAGISGTTNFIPKFTSAHALGNSAMADDGTSVIITSGGIFSVNEASGATTIGGLLTASAGITSTSGNTTVGNFRGQAITPTLTGGATVNDWAPTSNATAKNIYVNCPSGTCTITGMTGGADGREITIYNTGAGAIDLPHNSSSSAVGNKWNNATGTEHLAANAGCSADYKYSTTSGFWYLTGHVCNAFQDDGSTLTTPRGMLVGASSIQLASNGNIVTSGGTIEGALITPTGLNVYMAGSSLSYGYIAAGTYTGYINATSDSGGTGSFRNLWVCDGKGSASTNCFAQFDGTSHNITVSGRIVDSTPNGTSPMFDWQQAGQTEWAMYQIGLTNDLSLWNSSVAADITTWDSGGNLTHTKNLTVTGDNTVSTFVNQPVGSTGSYNGRHIEVYDEFLTPTPATVTNGSIFGTANNWVAAVSGTGAAVGYVYDPLNTSPGRPGLYSLAYTTSTPTNGYAGMSTAGYVYFPDGSTYTLETEVKWSALSATSFGTGSVYVSNLGFLDSAATASNPQNGCYFSYDASNIKTSGVNGTSHAQALECWCAKGGVHTGYLINGTGSSDNSFPLGTGTVAAATWYRLKIVASSTKAEFYRDGTKVCEIGSTNIPTSSSSILGAAYSILTAQATATASVLMELDFSRVAIDLSAARTP